MPIHAGRIVRASSTSSSKRGKTSGAGGGASDAALPRPRSSHSRSASYVSRSARVAWVAIQSRPRDAREHRPEPQDDRETDLRPVARRRRRLAPLAQQLEPRVGISVGAREGDEIVEQRAGERAPSGLVEAGDGGRLDARRPVLLRGEEAAEVRLVEVVEGGVPGAAGVPELLAQVGQGLRLVVELGERTRAEDAEDVRDLVEKTDVGLPCCLVAPRLVEEPVDEGGALLVRLAGGAVEKALEVDVRAAQRDVGRPVHEQHLGVRVREAPRPLQGIQEVERVSDVVLAAVLGIAAVRRAIRRRREVSADAPARHAAPARGRRSDSRTRRSSIAT
jgi:hypothetical protein